MSPTQSSRCRFGITIVAPIAALTWAFACATTAARPPLQLGTKECALAPAPASPNSDTENPEALPPARVVVSTPDDFRLDPNRAAAVRVQLQALQGEFERQLTEQSIPGWAWGLVVDHELVASNAGGTTAVDAGHPVTLNTAFRIGSITKSFTSLLTLQLRDAGKLGLDDPVARWLPELNTAIYPEYQARHIRVRDLIQHTSGLPRLGRLDYGDGAPTPTEAHLREALTDVELGFCPGTQSSYSNLGVATLGLVVERAGGEPYADALQHHILGPLGMTSSSLSKTAYSPTQLARPHRPSGSKMRVVDEWQLGAAAGMGGMYSTVVDMGRFMAALLAAWEPQVAAPTAEPWLSASTLRESQSQQLSKRLHTRWTSGASAETRPTSSSPTAHSSSTSAAVLETFVEGRGLGWDVDQDCQLAHIVSHGGATEGHTAQVIMLPDRGVGLVVLANGQTVALWKPALEVLHRLDRAGVLPARKRQISADLRKPLERMLQATEFSATLYSELFEEGFRREVPLAKMQSLLKDTQTELGRCTFAAPLSVRGPGDADVLFECKQGWLKLIAMLGQSTPRRISGLRLQALAERPRAAVACESPEAPKRP